MCIYYQEDWYLKIPLYLPFTMSFSETEGFSKHYQLPITAPHVHSHGEGPSISHIPSFLNKVGICHCNCKKTTKEESTSHIESCLSERDVWSDWYRYEFFLQEDTSARLDCLFGKLPEAYLIFGHLSDMISGKISRAMAIAIVRPQRLQRQ